MISVPENVEFGATMRMLTRLAPALFSSILIFAFVACANVSEYSTVSDDSSMPPHRPEGMLDESVNSLSRPEYSLSDSHAESDNEKDSHAIDHLSNRTALETLPGSEHFPAAHH